MPMRKRTTGRVISPGVLNNVSSHHVFLFSVIR
jgi:hypothetical protein